MAVGMRRIRKDWVYTPAARTTELEVSMSSFSHGNSRLDGAWRILWLDVGVSLAAREGI
jgi:hypothetical protein